MLCRFLRWAAVLAITVWAGPSPISAEVQAIRFREVSQEWGVDFRHRTGEQGDFFMIASMGSGVVAWDYDEDGDNDLFYVDSGSLPGAKNPHHRSTLYRNDGLAKFVDVTAASRIRFDTYGMGAVSGDVDGDGDLDLYVTCYGPNHLFRNNGDGTFVDVTADAGVGNPDWGASATLADFDGDSDLDLYLVNYVDFTFDNNPPCGLPHLGLRSYCHPAVYEGVQDRYFRNRGDGTFDEATVAAGFGQAKGKGLGVIAGDIDLDGWLDLYVANDMTPNYLFRNRGDGTFEDIALVAGTAYDEGGNVEAGMGVEMGDVDGNGLPDIMVTHLDQQTNALYSSAAPNLFVDRRFPLKFAESSFFKVGFGIVMADFDHDTDLDVAFANGHIIHNIEKMIKGTTFRQQNQVLENVDGKSFAEVVDSGLAVVRASRGMAGADLDSDGDVDLAINNIDDHAEIYENVNGSSASWLMVDLAGSTPHIGAEINLVTGPKTQRRELRTASSYMSQGSVVAHFGLGSAERVDSLRIVWPSGDKKVFRDLPINYRLRISP